MERRCLDHQDVIKRKEILGIWNIYIFSKVVIVEDYLFDVHPKNWGKMNPFWSILTIYSRSWFSHRLLVLVRFQEGKVRFCLSSYNSSIDHPTQLVVEED